MLQPLSGSELAAIRGASPSPAQRRVTDPARLPRGRLAGELNHESPPANLPPHLHPLPIPNIKSLYNRNE